MPVNPASASSANISPIDPEGLSALLGDGSDDAIGSLGGLFDGAAAVLLFNGLIQIGTSGNDVLPGGLGVNIMLGGPGDDIYHVDNPGDLVLEGANDGNDIVYASIDYTVPANVESVVLVGTSNIKATGNNLDNALIGNSGNNALDGWGGNDFMRGGAGNDLYFVDSAGDVVVEGANDGNDIIFASVDYTLSADVDSVVQVEGSAAIGAAGNDLDNALIGNSNDNVLDGKGGNDYMVGRAGNDVYYVDSVGDVVVENPNEGNDVVHSSVDYTLGDNVESIVLAPGAGNIDAAGNNLDNALIGNSGDNALDGKGGNDYMVGGAGNDIYFVDSAGDVVVENPNEGNDIVNSSVDYTLGANLESLVLIEGAGNINGSGNSAGNALIGNSGNNILDGEGGDDVMMGGGGDDTFRISDSAFASIDGGTGLDRITLTAPDLFFFDLTANAAKITNVEVISLAASVGVVLHVTNTDIPQVNASGKYLYVVGGSDDQVALGGSWIVVSISHTNPAVAPGMTFIQYHDAATNAELYISDTITFTGSFDPDNPPTVFLDGVPDGIDLPDGVGHLAAYTTGDAAGVAISDADASIDDPDPVDTPTVSAHIAQLVATLTDAHSGALEFLSLTGAGQTIAANNGIAAAGLNSATLTLSGSATDTVYQDLLREIRYVNTDQSAALDTTDRHVTVSAFDGIEHSNTATATISLTNGGDPGAFGQVFLLV